MNQVRFVIMLGLAALLSGCGAPSDAEQAAQNQLALAATVAAAPSAAPASPPPATEAPSAAPATATPDSDAARALQATAPPTSSASTVAPARPTATPRPTPRPSPTRTVAATTAPTTTQPSAVPATAVPATPAPPSPTTAEAPTVEPPSPVAPTAVPPSPLPPTAAPAEAPPDSDEPAVIGFEELYSGATISGPLLSEKAKRLNGRKVVMVGYMAPPLKPDLDFFVLTKTPMTYCPFCNSAADWPFDIVFVRMAGGKTVPPLVPTQGLRVTGTFSVGTDTDAATGFVSQVRIYADTVEELR